MKFKVGDRVKLNPTSMFAEQNKGVGTINCVFRNKVPYEYSVEWDTLEKGYFSKNFNYDTEDLLPAKIMWREKLK
jgi:hypothetical protein